MHVRTLLQQSCPTFFLQYGTSLDTSSLALRHLRLTTGPLIQYQLIFQFCLGDVGAVGVRLGMVWWIQSIGHTESAGKIFLLLLLDVVLDGIGLLVVVENGLPLS